MNRDVTGNYPAGSFVQQAGDGSYPSHLSQPWQHPSSNQHASQYPPSVPFYNTYNNDCGYPQQVTNAWNTWPEPNNNSANNFSVIPSTLNPQSDLSQEATSNISQLHLYYDRNNEQQQQQQQQQQHQNMGWEYMSVPSDYQMCQGQEPPSWPQPEPQVSMPHWETQTQQALETTAPGTALNFGYDPNLAPATDTKMELLTGHMQECTLNEPTHLEMNYTNALQKNLVEESNQEVLPSFQQVELLPKAGFSSSQVDLSETAPVSNEPPTIVPRKGSLFQPPVPSSSAAAATAPSPVPPLSSNQTPSIKPEQISSDLVLQHDVTDAGLTLEDASFSWSSSHTPEIKEESVLEEPVPEPVVSESSVHNEVHEALDSVEETASCSSGSRPNPLHLVLHRQHFSNDVDETCRTTLWENPIDSIPSVTLMPLAKPPKLDSKENEEESVNIKQKTSDQKLPLEESPRDTPASGPFTPVAQAEPEETPPSLGLAIDTGHSGSLPAAQSPPEKNSSESSPRSQVPPQDPLHRVSPPPVNGQRWTEDRIPEQGRQDHRRDRRNYDSRQFQEKPNYPDQQPDSRHFRPGYYPPPSGNYSSRPSSRASEPSGDNYYCYDREKTPSRMSEANDDRRNRDYDYSRNRSANYRSSDHMQRSYDDPRDFDNRSRVYEPRENYDYRRRNSGRGYTDHPSEHERNSRGGYIDGDVDYDQRQPYSDRLYSRTHHSDSYYRPNKGYDYYSGWPDPYAMYYAQYYQNYRASTYGSRNNYGYHKELYETDPKYRQQVDNYQAYLNSHQSQLDYDSDHPSLHSGRSSVNEELRRDRVDQSLEYSDTSLGDSISQPTPPPRMTPVKFSCSHSIGRLSQGCVLAVLPSYQTFTCSVNIYNIQNAFHYDPCLKDLKDFPGPLISGQTHKKDVMSFCQLKVQELQGTREQVLDRSSQILLWELLILLIRQNGNVIGSDIAELLLKDVHSISMAQTPTSTHTTGTSPLAMLNEDLREGPSNNNIGIHNNPADASPSSTPSPDEGIVVSQDRTIINNELSVHQVTRKFTEYLLYGNKKDALEWAIRHNLWGHALFLAYRMGSHSHANLMTRFANSLPLNDPLQTLYQLMSGRQPVSVTSVADEKWGDWRPHLAMILSNPTLNPQVDLRSIITLGDTLAQKGCLFAAHFCYLMAQVEFGTFDNKASKYVLLGSSHRLPFEKFASNEAIQLTEIYEYAMSLGKPNYMLANFQPYKFLYATRLADYGFLKESLRYCEVMSSSLLQFSSYVSLSLFKQIHQLGNQLKYHDPHYTHGAGELEELGDPPWLSQLQETILHLNEGKGCARESFASLDGQGNFVQDLNQGEHGSNYDYQQQNQYDYQQQQQLPLEQTGSEEQSRVTNSSAEHVSVMNVGSESWNNYAYPNNYSYSEGTPYFVPESDKLSQAQRDTSSQDEPNNSSPNYYDQIPTLKPTFPSQGSQNLFSRERQDSLSSNASRKGSLSSQLSSTAAASRDEGDSLHATSKAGQQSKQESSRKQDTGKPQAGGSWFGNLVNKFLPKGPPAAILPDDKSPRIVWDEKTKRWVDLDGNSDDVTNANVSPPKDSELAPLPSTGERFSVPGSPPSSEQNRFQRPKHRGMRQNYVDILNANTARSGSQSSLNTAPETLFPKMDTSAEIPSSFFIPSAVNVSDSTPDMNNPGASDFLSTDRNSLMQDTAASSQSPLLNPADFNITAAKQDMESVRKPTSGRLMGRRTYPS